MLVLANRSTAHSPFPRIHTSEYSRPGSSRASSRRSSIASSARSTKSARTDELNKLLNDRNKIATFHVPTVDHKKDLHHPPAHHKPHPPSKSSSRSLDGKKPEEKADKKKVKKPEGKGFFHSLVNKVRKLFC